jgi:hypothetical protein
MTIDGTRARAGDEESRDLSTDGARPRRTGFRRLVSDASRRRRDDAGAEVAALVLRRTTPDSPHDANPSGAVAHSILDRVEALVGIRDDGVAAPRTRWDSLVVAHGQRVELLVQAAQATVSITIAAPAAIAAEVVRRRRDLVARLERRGWQVARIRIVRCDRGRGGRP